MKNVIMGIATLALALTGCGGGGLDEVEEVGHAAADVFASFDEATDSNQNGGLALNRSDVNRGTLLDTASELMMPKAYAAPLACWLVNFSACDAGKRVRDFNGCGVGFTGATLDGKVELQFSNTSCSLPLSATESITRTADFTLTGRRGATLVVSSEGDGASGQKLTKLGEGSWAYTVYGMHRVMTGPGGRQWFDIQTKTLEDILVSGANRANRIVTAGTMEIRHNLAKYTTVFSPSDVTWDGTCTCPVSGELTGTVTPDGEDAKDAKLVITGCGTGTITLDGESKDVQFDRCLALVQN